MAPDKVAHKSSSGGAPAVGFGARRLAVLLGLGPLLDVRACHGYENGCVCSRCEDRARKFEVLLSRFPRHLAAVYAKEDAA